jgi:hypothetical protein
MVRRAVLATVGLLVASFAVAAPSWAQAPPTGRLRDVAGAEALFAEGKRLMDAGNVAAACPKFEESQRLDPGMGTLLNLAACREKEGRIATAWGHYREAEAQLEREADPRRAAFAKERATALEPRLPMLVVTIEAPPEGLVVLRDGIQMSSASLGSRLPIDPGEHAILARAPGRISHERKFVAAERELVQLRIAELGVAPLPPPVVGPPTGDPRGATEPPAESSGGNTQKTVAFVLGGVGIVSMVAGLVFVGATAAQKSAADDNCPTVTTCSAAGFDAIATAKDLARAANITLIGGAALTGAGVVLYVTAPSGSSSSAPPPPPSAVWIAPSFSPSDLGVRAAASF